MAAGVRVVQAPCSAARGRPGQRAPHYVALVNVFGELPAAPSRSHLPPPVSALAVTLAYLPVGAVLTYVTLVLAALRELAGDAPDRLLPDSVVAAMALVLGTGLPAFLTYRSSAASFSERVTVGGAGFALAAITTLLASEADTATPSRLREWLASAVVFAVFFAPIATILPVLGLEGFLWLKRWRGR